MIEIEKKFHVGNPEQVRRTLLDKGRLVKTVRKEDFYFAGFSDTNIPFTADGDPSVGPGQVRALNQALGLDMDAGRSYHFFRIRAKDRRALTATLKLRSVIRGLEQNVEEERELEPGHLTRAKELVAGTPGFTAFFTKTKDSMVFSVLGAEAELVYAPEIEMWLLEVELTADDAGRAAASEKLDRILGELGFGGETPEPRPWPRLIKDTLGLECGDATLERMSERNLARFLALELAGP